MKCFFRYLTLPLALLFITACETTSSDSTSTKDSSRLKNQAHAFRIKIIDYSRETPSPLTSKNRVLLQKQFDYTSNESIQMSEAGAIKLGDLIAIRPDSTTSNNEIYSQLAIATGRKNSPLLIVNSSSILELKSADYLKGKKWELFRLNDQQHLNEYMFNDFIIKALEMSETRGNLTFHGIVGLPDAGIASQNSSPPGNQFTSASLATAAYLYSGIQLHSNEQSSLFNTISIYQVISSIGQVLEDPKFHLVPEEL